MKLLPVILTTSYVLSGSMNAATTFVSEIHYDNGTTSDTGETIELYAQLGIPPSDITISLYTGDGANPGTIYDSSTTGDLTFGGTVNLSGTTFNIYTWSLPTNGIQNGNDGIAVDVSGTLCEFISYEGPFTPAFGIASGVTSTDIGVAQSNSTAVGSSMELTDSGWESISDGTNTFGSANPGLTINPIPEPSAALLGGLALLGFLRRRR